MHYGDNIGPIARFRPDAAVVHILDTDQQGPHNNVSPAFLHFFCVHFGIVLRARHIQGRENTQADALSCNLLQVFFRELPAVPVVCRSLHKIFGLSGSFELLLVLGFPQ